MQDNQPASYRWPDHPSHARFVVHVPVAARDLDSAVRLARVLARRAATIPGTEPGDITVSHLDGQSAAREGQHRAFCRLPLPWRRRCGLPASHDGPCRTVTIAPDR